MLTGLGYSAPITGFSFYVTDGGPPPILPDTVLPVVTAFNLLSASDNLTVPITLLAAADLDAYGVPGTIAKWFLSESSSKPAGGDSGWRTVKPTFYTFAAQGSKTLYAFAKDGAGNVSAGKAATTVITLPAPVSGIDYTATTRVFTQQNAGQVFTMGKQPGEVLVGIGIDFRRFLARGETLTTAACSGGTFLRVAGSAAFCVISGGANGETLRVTLTAHGDKGNVVEGELKVVVKEV